MTGGTRNPAGTRLLTTSTDRTARIWDAATGQLIDWQLEQLPKSELAVWSSTDHQLLGASDGTWRWLGWLVPQDGRLVRLPAETWSSPTAAPTNHSAALTSRGCAPCPEPTSGSATDISRQLLAHPQQQEGPAQTWTFESVEVLTAYSHSMQAADMPLCHAAARTSPVCAARPSTKRPWSLRDRLNESDIADLTTAYRDGATAAYLAAAHGVSLKSVKRLLRTAGIRRTPPTRRSAKTTPTATHP